MVESGDPRDVRSVSFHMLCDKQTSMTTNVVDDSPFSSASAPSCRPLTRTAVADEHKFSAVRLMSRRLLDRSKNAILPTPPVFGAPLRGDPIGMHRSFAQ